MWQARADALDWCAGLPGNEVGIIRMFLLRQLGCETPICLPRAFLLLTTRPPVIPAGVGGSHAPVAAVFISFHSFIIFIFSLVFLQEWEAAAKAGLITAEAPSADKKKTGAKVGPRVCRAAPPKYFDHDADWSIHTWTGACHWASPYRCKPLHRKGLMLLSRNLCGPAPYAHAKRPPPACQLCTTFPCTLPHASPPARCPRA